MSITNSSSARRAGFKVNDKAIKEDAAIAMSKIGCRTLYIALPPSAFHLAGTSVAVATDGVFPVITLPDANAGNLYTSVRLPAQYDSGTMTLSIYWKCTPVAGNVKFTVDVAGKADNASAALEETLTVTTAAATTAGQINRSQVTMTASNFTAGDLIGIKITRDPTDAADTLGANISFISAVIEYTGRG